jgi:putative membrane protein
MDLIAKILVAAVALLHIYVLVLEMFLWTAPRTLKSFGQTLEQAQASRVMAANQGLYNGFLAVGLIWGLVHPDPAFAWQIQIFFLACVIVAGLYGGLTAKRSILYVQALPGLIALVAVWLA